MPVLVAGGAGFLGSHVVGPLLGQALRLANVYGPRRRAEGDGGVVAIGCDRVRRGPASANLSSAPALAGHPDRI
jgi:nucleoside-diphosphate-sugar epimerase